MLEIFILYMSIYIVLCIHVFIKVFTSFIHFNVYLNIDILKIKYA